MITSVAQCLPKVMWSTKHVKLASYFTLLHHSVPDSQIDWYVNARFEYWPLINDVLYSLGKVAGGRVAIPN